MSDKKLTGLTYGAAYMPQAQKGPQTDSKIMRTQQAFNVEMGLPNPFGHVQTARPTSVAQRPQQSTTQASDRTS